MNKIIRTSKNLEKLIWDELLQEFNKAKSLKAIDRLFNILTTAQERETIARRLATFSLIRKGLSYKEISRRLWISPLTISTIKKSILNNNGYKSYYWSKIGNLKELKLNRRPLPVSRSAFDGWLDHIAFLIENAPQKSGPRWKYLNYGKINTK